MSLELIGVEAHAPPIRPVEHHVAVCGRLGVYGLFLTGVPGTHTVMNGVKKRTGMLAVSLQRKRVDWGR